MIIQQAINAAINSQEFIRCLSQSNINANRCWKLDAKIVNVSQNQLVAIEVKFDFGANGPDPSDVVVRVFVDAANANQANVHSVFTHPWHV